MSRPFQFFPAFFVSDSRPSQVSLETHVWPPFLLILLIPLNTAEQFIECTCDGTRPDKTTKQNSGTLCDGLTKLELSMAVVECFRAHLVGDTPKDREERTRKSQKRSTTLGFCVVMVRRT